VNEKEGVVMKGKIYTSILTAVVGLVAVFLTNCSSTPPLQIAATSGSQQSALPHAGFPAPLVATVTRGGHPVTGVQVTFTAPSSGASGSFVDGTNSETETTDASGVATSTKFTSNETAGTYTVTATVTGASANFAMTNTAATYYAFYVSGQEAIDNTAGQPNYYALAGSVAVDPHGNVLAGEQDYNDAYGYTSPQPTGDVITGGVLTADTNGQGTLTLITNNARLGSSGTETLGIQFVNASHALIAQFDGSATSSGSFDMQTLPSAIAGGYAFSLSGVDARYNGFSFGGVFSVNNGSLTGSADVNDDGGVTLAEGFNGAIEVPDNFGRGQVSGVTVNGNTLTLDYYIVGAEAIRIVVVDPKISCLGSAFGQGTNAGGATNASLGNSVFGMQPNSWGYPLYSAIGMLTPDSATATFTGVGDNDQEGSIVKASAISGTYTIASNGYGSVSITNGGLLGLTTLGVYLTDPNLNLLDPNNTTGGGGAVLVDLDAGFAGGTGLAVPQTDTSSTSFTGPYAFGTQDFNGSSTAGWEFDYAGQGSISAGALTGTGLVSDAFGYFSATPAVYTATPVSGMATADGAHPGRYTMPLQVAAINGSPASFSVAVYQAAGGTLFWMDEDATSSSVGVLEQQSTASLSNLPAKRERMARSRIQPDLSAMMNTPRKMN
jgi:hypothetical protein